MNVTTNGGLPTADPALTEKRLSTILRHISNVREDCELLGNKLIEQGEMDTGRKLIANGLIHDNSKLHGIEWAYLHQDILEKEELLFKAAAKQHVHTNPHHPEYWGDIEQMPRVYVAEMVCDWHARSSEFGTDLRAWIKEKAFTKYKIPINGRIHGEIKEFLILLLDRRFA